MINVSIVKICRAKRKAKNDMFGTDMEQYQYLWSYVATIRETNPGSTVKLKLLCLQMVQMGHLKDCIIAFMPASRDFSMAADQ